MATQYDITLGELVPFFELIQSMLDETSLVDINAFFDDIEQLLRSANQWNDEIAADLAIARQMLGANPGLFDEGKGTFTAFVDGLLAKYPPSTPISQIPELSGTGGGGEGPGELPPIDIGEGGFYFAALDILRASATVEYNAQTGEITYTTAGIQTVLSNVDRLKFLDGVLAFDLDGNPGQSYRIYQAVFDREPDDGGLSFWIQTMDGGMDIYQVALRFLDSDEFQSTYGGTSNADFINLLYLNVMGRSADGSGADWWTEQLDNGTYDRAHVLASFTESPEFVGYYADLLSGGIWYAA